MTNSFETKKECAQRKVKCLLFFVEGGGSKGIGAQIRLSRKFQI